MSRLRTFSTLWVSLFLLIAATSCEKALLGGEPANDPEQVFEFLWNDINNRYAYFELKSIDWVEVKKRYQPMVYTGMTDEELFDVLADMLFELEDGHVNLTSPFNRSRNWNWFQNFPLNYNQGIIDRQYLGNDFWITGPLRNQMIDSILYVNYRTFGDEVSDQNVEELMRRAQGASGLIIDVRSNSGGSLANALKLAGAFTEKSYTYGSVRIKSGPCPDCFSSWTDLRVEARNGLRYRGPVVVLTNHASYSSTTYFTEMMRQNPNATIVGAPTGGGGGTPAFGELPNGWTYRFSSIQAVNIDGEHLELGVPVDVAVDLNKTDEDQGIDTILEAALDMLR
jgi:hypothetical protein